MLGFQIFTSVLARLSHRAILLFVQSWSSLPSPGLCPTQFARNLRYGVYGTANVFDSAGEFQAYVEHVSVVLVALYDALFLALHLLALYGL